MAAKKNNKALELIRDADEYFVLVPNGDDWTYVWIVADEASQDRFIEALAKFQEA